MKSHEWPAGFWVQPPALADAAARVTWVTVSCGGVGVGGVALGVAVGMGVDEGACFGEEITGCGVLGSTAGGALGGG
jgi:hypothetical protein